MKWIRRLLSFAVIAAGYGVLLCLGLFLVSAKGTDVLSMPSYASYSGFSKSPVLFCGGAAVLAGLLAGLFSWVKTQLDVKTGIHMQEMIRTDVSEATGHQTDFSRPAPERRAETSHPAAAQAFRPDPRPQPAPWIQQPVMNAAERDAAAAWTEKAWEASAPSAARETDILNTAVPQQAPRPKAPAVPRPQAVPGPNPETLQQEASRPNPETLPQEAPRPVKAAAAQPPREHRQWAAGKTLLQEEDEDDD